MTRMLCRLAMASVSSMWARISASISNGDFSSAPPARNVRAQLTPSSSMTPYCSSTASASNFDQIAGGISPVPGSK